MIDFTTFNHQEISEFLVAHQAELDCKDISGKYVADSLRTGQAVLETRPYGFALVEPMRVSGDECYCYLWVLYVDKDRRNSGIGRQFVAELLDKFAADQPMALSCYGIWRMMFFNRCGFRTESTSGELRQMIRRPATSR